MGKKLSDTDKEQVRKYASEHADHSKGAVYRVDVEDELTEDGVARYTILYMQEKEMPKGWKPS